MFAKKNALDRINAELLGNDSNLERNASFVGETLVKMRPPWHSHFLEIVVLRKHGANRLIELSELLGDQPRNKWDLTLNQIFLHVADSIAKTLKNWLFDLNVNVNRSSSESICPYKTVLVLNSNTFSTVF